APNMNQAYIDCSLHYYQSLLRTGLPMENVQLRIMVNEIHHEKYWADHFAEFLQFCLN
ncbi:alpha/beta hydrolase, partial [Enterococcus faecium]